LIPDLDAFDPAAVTGQIYRARSPSCRDSCVDSNWVLSSVAIVHQDAVESDSGILNQDLNSPEGALGFADMDPVMVGAAVHIGLAQV